MSCDAKEACREEPHLCSWPNCKSARAREAEHMAATLAKVTRRQAFAAAREMSAMKYRREPNWAFAMKLDGLGSTYAWAICEEMGVDPDATTATRWPDPALTAPALARGGA